MAGEWVEESLGDAIDIKHGFAFKGEFFRDEPPGDVLLTPGNFAIGGGFKADKFKYYDGPVPDDFVLHDGDLLVTMTDLSKQADTLGYPAFVPRRNDGPRYLHNQRLGKIIIRDETSLDVRYLHYLMCGREYRHEVLASATGTTVKHTSPERIKRFRFLRPPLPEQRAIAHILGTLDDKIELNRRMNETLEAMARALFQSWFVDFDPVRAKIEGRDPGLPKEIADLFPDRFEDSGRGEIPAGWRVETIGDIASRIAMGPFGSRITRDNFAPSGVPVVRGNNLRGGFYDADFVFLTETKADELRSAIAKPGDLVFTHRGTLGQVGMIPTLARYPRYVVSQSQMLLSVDGSKASARIVYQFFRSEQGQAALLANTSTTGVPAIARPTTSLKAIRIVLPPKEVSDRFEAVVEPLTLRCERSTHEVETLAALRDTLLPKLISGELRVQDAQRFVGGVDTIDEVGRGGA